ncbi:hypothetical protein [Thermus thermamylovorans]|uniref:Uncharacterized protein n=1 Tax=Thermus thermamylovorans TaxID=2509362 RepID=A0A4Q9B5R1_9DEIN|nr:hypothetical protein [Thermus thermamylovorans]TBH21370.1 hypothetical protein ETP66_01810 [Thermus thermamylovorans]
MDDPLAHLPQELLRKDPLAYVAQGAQALPQRLRGAWLLGVVSGFLWPEAPPPKDLAALFRRAEGAWREAEAHFLETGVDFPVLVSEWARSALEPLLRRRSGPDYPELLPAYLRGQALGWRLRRGIS